MLALLSQFFLTHIRDFFQLATSPMMPQPCLFSLVLLSFFCLFYLSSLPSQFLFLSNSEPCSYFICVLGSYRPSEDLTFLSDSYQGTFLNNGIVFLSGILSPTVKQNFKAVYEFILSERERLLISGPQSFCIETCPRVYSTSAA